MKKTLRKVSTMLTATIIAAFTVAAPVFAKDVSDFTDVHEGDWFYNPVADVAEKELILGTSDATFEPTKNLERGQLATILWRMDGSLDVPYGYRFPDVADGIFYSVPVTWAYDFGVISGYNDGTFGPSDKITCEQLATMLYRYAGKNGYDRTVTGDIYSFSDGGRVSGFAADSMSWAVGAGILKGEADGRLNPQGDVSRAVCATMISRMSNLEGGNTSEPAQHTHNWVPRYEMVTIQNAYDEPVYENQPIYEDQPVYSEVTKYRNTSICSCGAIGITYDQTDDPNSGHGGHALANYREPYTETVQTGTQRVQVGVQPVQVGTKHHDAVVEERAVGYICSECGATK